MTLVQNTPASWSERAASPCPLEAVGWSSHGQQDRFAAVLQALQPTAGESLLDFGCGTGALARRLPAGVEYLGYDWAAGMIARAQADYPESRFEAFLPAGAFDTVAAIGPFNLPDNWSKAETWATLRRLFDRCRRALAVCLYSGDDPDCIRYQPHEVASVCDSTASRWRLERHRPNDLLAVMWR